MSIHPVSAKKSNHVLRPSRALPKLQEKVEKTFKNKLSQEGAKKEDVAKKNYKKRLPIESFGSENSAQEHLYSKKPRIQEAFEMTSSFSDLFQDDISAAKFCSQTPMEKSIQEAFEITSSFSDLFQVDLSAVKPCPQTPMKKSYQRASTPLTDTCRQIAAGTLLRGGRVHKLVPDLKARGDYRQLHRIPDESYPLIEGYANSQIRVKAFHEYCLNRDTARKVEGFMKQISKQYLQLRDLGFPIAPTLNSPLLDGYEVVVYIEHAIDIKIWAGNVSVASLDASTVSLLKQARGIFTKAAKGNLLMDLGPRNLHFNDQNELYIIDSMVEEDCLDSMLDTEDQVAAQCWLKFALTSWANGNPYVYAYLTKNIAKMGTSAANALASFG